MPELKIMSDPDCDVSTQAYTNTRKVQDLIHSIATLEWLLGLTTSIVLWVFMILKRHKNIKQWAKSQGGSTSFIYPNLMKAINAYTYSCTSV